MAAPTFDETSRLVGWINRLEWETVFEKLYTNDVQLQKQAVDRIGAWKSREQIPVSIECSASLVRAQIMDKQGDSADAVQLAYSIAIIRFVNLITGREQKGIVSKSVSFLASKVGLPSWMVDLRHEAAHRFLPSLVVLREGANQALSWLRKEYWEAQNKKGHLEEAPEGCTTDSETNESVSACIIQYQQEQFHEITDSQGQSHGNLCCDNSLVDLEELLTTNDNARHIVTSVLLQDGYLVPTEEQLTSLKVTVVYNKDTKHIPVLDTKFITFWTPLLRLLHSLNITPLLLASLLRELAKFAQPDNKTAECLQGWAVFIATEASRGPTTTSSPGAKRSKSPHHKTGDVTKTLYEGCKTIRLPWNDLVDICLKNPNPYTLSVLPLMLMHMTPKPTRQMADKIIRLSSIITMSPKELEIKKQRKKGNTKKSKKFKKKTQDNNSAVGNTVCLEDTNTINQAEARNKIVVDEENTNLDNEDTSFRDESIQGQPIQDGAKEGLGDTYTESRIDDVSITSEQSDGVTVAEVTCMHSAQDLAALVREKRAQLQSGTSFIGIHAQSAKDAKKLRKRKRGAWARCKNAGVDWSAYPLGVLPGQPNDPDYFLLNVHNGNRKERSLEQTASDQDSEPTGGKSPKFQCDETVKSYTRERKSGHAFETGNPSKTSRDMSNMKAGQLEREIPKGESPWMSAVIQARLNADGIDNSDVSLHANSRNLNQLPEDGPSGENAGILELDVREGNVDEEMTTEKDNEMEPESESQVAITLF